MSVRHAGQTAMTFALGTIVLALFALALVLLVVLSFRAVSASEVAANRSR